MITASSLKQLLRVWSKYSFWNCQNFHAENDSQWLKLGKTNFTMQGKTKLLLEELWGKTFQAGNQKITESARQQVLSLCRDPGKQGMGQQSCHQEGVTRTPPGGSAKKVLDRRNYQSWQWCQPDSLGAKCWGGWPSDQSCCNLNN